MKMLLLDVYNNKVSIVNATGLDDYYKHLGCRCIDIVRRKIGDIEVEIIVDDEGLLVENPKPSAIGANGEIMLVGNLLIASGKVIDGELTGLKKKELENILNYFGEITIPTYSEPYKVLTGMGY